MRYLRFFAISLIAVLLAACADTSETTTTDATTPTTNALAIPTGNYAFVRDGDLWARTGHGVAHPLTTLSLSPSFADWGQIAWSPDQSEIAFVLHAPPFAPGVDSLVPSQVIGSLLILRSDSGLFQSLGAVRDSIAIPVEGRHIAWVDQQNILYTQGGRVQRISLSNPITTGTITGPQNVWEIVLRGDSLWYSTVRDVSATGAGTAELRRYDLTKKTDQLVATLGPVTLPAAQCGGIVCPPDLTTPVVPYAWDVSPDGTRVAFQQVGEAPPAFDPTATSTPTSVDTTTPASKTLNVILANADGTAPRQLFRGITSPTEVASLAFAPDGQQIALSLAVPANLPYGPFVQSLKTGQVQTARVPSSALTTAVSLSGDITWSRDSHAFSLTMREAVSPSTPDVVNFIDGQGVVVERNADTFVWAG